MKNEHWVINVSNWGTLYAFGTEKEAEEWRKHKARYEGSPATKRLATPEEASEQIFMSLTHLTK